MYLSNDYKDVCDNLNLLEVLADLLVCRDSSSASTTFESLFARQKNFGAARGKSWKSTGVRIVKQRKACHTQRYTTKITSVQWLFWLTPQAEHSCLIHWGEIMKHVFIRSKSLSLLRSKPLSPFCHWNFPFSIFLCLQLGWFYTTCKSDDTMVSH